MFINPKVFYITATYLREEMPLSMNVSIHAIKRGTFYDLYIMARKAQSQCWTKRALLGN